MNHHAEVGEGRLTTGMVQQLGTLQQLDGSLLSNRRFSVNLIRCNAKDSPKFNV